MKVINSSPPREQESGSDQFISPEEFRAFPTAEARKENRKGRSMIPTDKLNKEKLEEGHSNMKPPQQKKKHNKTKK